MLRPLPKSDDPITCAITGAAFEVQRLLGTGFREVFYRDALAIEFRERRIPFEREVPCSIRYKGRQLGGEHYIDFVCFEQVIVEVTARASIGPADDAQLLTCLASSRRPLGLLLNMGGSTLDVKRVLWPPDGRLPADETAESSVSKLKG